MKWEKRTPAVTSWIFQSGPVRLAIGPAENDPGRLWQHFMLTVGRHTTSPVSDCQRDWPRQAIADARAALDEFEAQLEEAD